MRGLAGNSEEQSLPPGAAGSRGGLEAGQKSDLIYVLKGATQVRVWRLDRRSSKTG